jgi:hypothetical protein
MTKHELDAQRVFVIHDFLTSDECAALIRRSEGLAFEVGTVGAAVFEEVRNNERVLIDDAALAEDFYRRAAPFVPAVIEGRPLSGFNERWRFYRYGPGQAFKPHRDGVHTRFTTMEQSRLTFMIYLNESAAGGATRFYADIDRAFVTREPYLSVTPKTGVALVFVHRVWHEGAVVESGQKYVLRTDVMYGPVRPVG